MIISKITFIHFVFILSLIVTLGLDIGCRGTNNTSNFNGGFEIKKGNLNEPQGWNATRVSQTKDYVIFSWDAAVKHSGEHSVSISIDSTHPNEIIDYNWVRSFPDFKINKKYSISGWIKTLNLKTTAFLVVQCWKDNKNMAAFFTNEGKQPVTGTTDWKLVKYDFTVPEGTKEVLIRAGIAAPDNNGGKVWFDDIKIE